MSIYTKTLFVAFMTAYAYLGAAQSTATYHTFRGDASHTGIYPSAEVNNNPHVKWKFKTNGYVHTSAAIDGDRIYFGSTDSNLYCLDANTGNLKWKYKTDGAVSSSPAIDNGIIYFASHDGNFYALNAASGKQKWIFKTNGEKRFSGKHLHGQEPADSVFVDQWDFWLSSPIAYHNKIYFGSGDGNLYALDAARGTQVWKFATDGIIHSSPAIAFGNVYFGGWDTYMHAVDAESGKEVWKFQTGIDTVIHNQTGITGSALISGDMVYFGCRDSYLYALNAKTGNLVWKKFNDRGWISLTPVVYGDKLIYASGSSQRLVAVNKMTGDSIYQKQMNTGFFASPTIAGETLYQGEFNGVMTALDVNNGDIKWRFETDGLKNDPFSILDSQHRVDQNKFQAAAEKYKGKYSFLDIRLSTGSITSSPVIKNKVIYFGSTDGNFYALE
jgi:outer membrane protein assembly factor BamB